MRRLVVCLTAGLGLLVTAAEVGAAPPAKKKIVLIAGKKSHGPEGNGIHDYGWSVRLLKVMLDNSNVKDRVKVEYHLGGWPRNPKTLEDADAIVIISDGRDGDKFEEAPHLASPERVRLFDRLVKRGCGLAVIHFSTFAPQKYADKVLDWTGGYFQWESQDKRRWYSAISTMEAEIQLAAPKQPVSRGLKTFRMKEEFYYNLRFRAKDEAVKPVWVVPALKGRKGDGNVVAWVRDPKKGGRGFGTTCGHFYDNWKQEQFRRLVLNALVWTAKVDLPKGGVTAKFYTHDEIRKALGEPGTPAKPSGQGR
jgi:type 1 glutamine amidotransferase